MAAQGTIIPLITIHICASVQNITYNMNFPHSNNICSYKFDYNTASVSCWKIQQLDLDCSNLHICRYRKWFHKENHCKLCFCFKQMKTFVAIRWVYVNGSALKATTIHINASFLFCTLLCFQFWFQRRPITRVLTETSHIPHILHTLTGMFSTEAKQTLQIIIISCTFVRQQHEQISLIHLFSLRFSLSTFLRPSNSE